MELKRMIETYLLQNWGLVTLSITIEVLGILKISFVGNEIIISRRYIVLNEVCVKRIAVDVQG